MGQTRVVQRSDSRVTRDLGCPMVTPGTGASDSMAALMTRQPLHAALDAQRRSAARVQCFPVGAPLPQTCAYLFSIQNTGNIRPRYEDSVQPTPMIWGPQNQKPFVQRTCPRAIMLCERDPVLLVLCRAALLVSLHPRIPSPRRPDIIA